MTGLAAIATDIEQGTVPVTVTVTVTGEIDMTNAESLTGTILGALPNDPATVRLDLTGVGYLDSTGIRLVDTLAEHTRRHDQQLHLIAPPGSPPRVVLDLADITALAPLHDTLHDTLDAAPAPAPPDPRRAAGAEPRARPTTEDR